MGNFQLVFIVLGLLITSCAKIEIKGKTKAEVLYKEAMKLKGEERYLMALDKISSLRSTYPYSFYSIPSELLRADILFAQENYIEAADAYLTFRDFHPKHKKISYVMWMVAEAYFMQLPETIDRDLSSAQDAIIAYQEVRKRYPDSQYAKDAQNKIKESMELVEKREEYIADFYFRTEDYQSASYRYNHILFNSSFIENKKRAAHRLVRSLLELGKFSDCIAMINLGQKNSFLTEEEITIFQDKCSSGQKIKEREKGVAND